MHVLLDILFDKLLELIILLLYFYNSTLLALYQILALHLLIFYTILKLESLLSKSTILINFINLNLVLFHATTDIFI